jgi:hypothetical protein
MTQSGEHVKIRSFEFGAFGFNLFPYFYVNRLHGE